MSRDIVHVQWHLTPRGWVRGDWSANEPLESRTPPPADRVETWVTTETTYDMQFAKDVERAALRATVRDLAPESETAKPDSQDFPLH